MADSRRRAQCRRGIDLYPHSLYWGTRRMVEKLTCDRARMRQTVALFAAMRTPFLKSARPPTRRPPNQACCAALRSASICRNSRPAGSNSRRHHRHDSLAPEQAKGKPFQNEAWAPGSGQPDCATTSSAAWLRRSPARTSFALFCGHPSATHGVNRQSIGLTTCIRA